ncbi:MAG: hypothetical protein WC631_02900 [Candidatus Paceibacterota bacterium]|jgi:hypothetical protein
MKRFFIKSIACLLLATFLVGILPVLKAVAAGTGATPSTFGAPTAPITNTTDRNTLSNAVAASGNGNKNIDYNLYATSTDNTSVWAKIGDFGLGVLSLPVFLQTSTAIDTLIGIASVSLAISAGIFDAAIRFSIINFSEMFSQGSAFVTAWQMLRDIINVSFIFILLYIAITKIIGSFGIKAKTTLMNVVLSAIFINFSMFVAKLIIDIGNILAVVLYNNIVGLKALGLSELLMNGLNLQSFFSISVLSYSGQTHMMIMLLLQLAMTIITCWAFSYAIYLFIGRSVMLILLIITSPVAFIGGTIPWLKEKSAEWWSTLISQVLVAPVFLFFMFIVIKMMQVGNSFQTIKSATGGFALNTSGYFYYAIVMGILISGMKITKKMSGAIGGIIDKVIKAVLAIVAIAITGGVAVAAGGVGVAAAGAGRLARLGSAVSSLASGRITKTPGARGVLYNYGRNKIMGLTKEVTAGKIDLKGLEKTLKQSQKESTEKLVEMSNKLGPADAIKRRNQIEDTKKNISAQAEYRIMSSDDVEDIASRQKLEKAKKNLEAAQALGDKNSIDTAQGVLTDAHKEFSDRVKAMMDTVAGEMGTSTDTLKKSLDSIDIEIAQKTAARNKFIAELPNQGFFATGLSREDREKLANEMRAAKGGQYKAEDSELSKFKKFLKDSGYKKGDEEETSEGKNKDVKGGESKKEK